ncbi:G-type lectin S-receptor-like serine/threonine-protein kinase [Citrus sinensis]|nr:G-type lectin S-receptor-like serine/threonine-protein kinase [Citrus sinensis]
MENLFSFYIINSLISLLTLHFSLAADTITPATFICDGEKLVSSSQRFELGFLSPGNSKNIVWVANRNTPILDPHGVLASSNNGNLVLLNQANGTIWSSNVSRELKSPVAQLLDTGNLVLRDNFSSNTSEGSYLWQSFDYPSDTLLPGMKLGWDLKTGGERYQTSWRTINDPYPGNFTLRLDIHVMPQICIYSGSVRLFRLGPWNGFRFEDAATYYFPQTTYIQYLYKQIVVDTEDEFYYRYEPYNSLSITILKLYLSGKVQRLLWSDESYSWLVAFSAPDDLCQNYGHCGANSICNVNKTPKCECLKGFRPESQHNQTFGSQFIKFDDMQVPDLLEVLLNESMNLKECEAECLKNCTCRAYGNSNLIGGGSGCLMWFGDMIDMKRTLGNLTGQSIYLRAPASQLGKKKTLWIVVLIALPVVILPAFFIFYGRKRKLKEKERRRTEVSQDMLLFEINIGNMTRAKEFCEGDSAAKGKSKESWFIFFSLASISAATHNFSEENKLGEGGFGPVYKGKLLNGEEVAVKRLSNKSGQGVEEFKNEMILIAKLHHRNLVRLFGYCIEQGEKILIYEYMPNKSLDFFLFDPASKGILDWTTRVRIIEGIAQGLLYLHQYSRLRVIHRDLKASNVLLDGDMNPKISDFGIARMFGGDELQSNMNRIVGTYGYMSPEYALHGLFSIKSDVFSFGVLLLETLSSKKNTRFYNIDSLTLLGHAWNLWKDDRAWKLLDPTLQNEALYPMVKRYIKVALLCVQENAADRPTMSEVVSMLKNEIVNLPSPQQPAFSYVRIVEKSVLLENSEAEASSGNCLTLSMVDAR